MTPPEQLRNWAADDHPRGAAVELLIRARLAGDERTWVMHDHAWNTRAIDFDDLRENAATLDTAEAALALIACSLADGSAIDLRRSSTGLDRTQTELVMIAIAHAAGYTEFTSETDAADGLPDVVPVPPLASWPD